MHAAYGRSAPSVLVLNTKLKYYNPKGTLPLDSKENGMTIQYSTLYYDLFLL